MEDEAEQLRVSLDRLRTLLETLILRGLRACGEEELTQLRSYTSELEHGGAGHVAANLAELAEQIAGSDRAAPTTLVRALTAVRLFERLLTLRVAQATFAAAAALSDEEPA